MSDWEPQVVRILKVEAHPDANALDVVIVLKDYPVVVKRNEYKEGDLASYIPIDTVVPDTERFYFLCPLSQRTYEENGEVKTRSEPRFALGEVPEKNRIIKAKKIRGVYSQGMLIPCPEGMKEADSVTDLMELKKWEEEEEENIKQLKGLNLNKGLGAESPPKGWDIPHYDIESMRKCAASFDDDEEIILTEKIHGSNAAFVHDGTRLWVKSRNLYRKMDPDDFWWDVAIRYNLEDKLKTVPNMIFFGEVYGHVKAFKYDATVRGNKVETRVRFFDVLDHTTKRFLDFDDRCELIQRCGLECVPLLYRGPWLGKEKMYAHAEGATTLGAGKHVREGWVLNTCKARAAAWAGSRVHLKLVGQGYNLQK